VLFALFGLALLQEGGMLGFAIGRKLGKQRFTAQVAAGLDHEIVILRGQLFLRVIKPNGIAPKIPHGIMQPADGGLFLAFGIEVEHADGAGGCGVGRDGGEESEDGGFHGCGWSVAEKNVSWRGCCADIFWEESATRVI
jgi:hypothetical protein